MRGRVQGACSKCLLYYTLRNIIITIIIIIIITVLLFLLFNLERYVNSEVPSAVPRVGCSKDGDTTTFITVAVMFDTKNGRGYLSGRYSSVSSVAEP